MEQLRSLFSRNALSRRSFLAGAGTAAAGTLIAGCGSGGPAILPAVTAYNDVDILNFALNLEYAEAEFYMRAATGSGLSTTDAGSGAGSVTGGAQIPNLTPQQQSFLNEIAYTEQQHVRFMRSTLGVGCGVTANSRFDSRIWWGGDCGEFADGDLFFDDVAEYSNKL